MASKLSVPDIFLLILIEMRNEVKPDFNHLKQISLVKDH